MQAFLIAFGAVAAVVPGNQLRHGVAAFDLIAAGVLQHYIHDLGQGDKRDGHDTRGLSRERALFEFADGYVSFMVLFLFMLNCYFPVNKIFPKY